MSSIYNTLIVLLVLTLDFFLALDDMADNAKTAFDPIFYSHHSNIDRIFYNWQLAHPNVIYYAIPFPFFKF